MRLRCSSTRYLHGALAEAIAAWANYIRQETLANSLTASSAAESFAPANIAGEEMRLKRGKTT